MNNRRLRAVTLDKKDYHFHFIPKLYSNIMLVYRYITWFRLVVEIISTEIDIFESNIYCTCICHKDVDPAKLSEVWDLFHKRFMSPQLKSCDKISSFNHINPNHLIGSPIWTCHDSLCAKLWPDLIYIFTQQQHLYSIKLWIISSQVRCKMVPEIELYCFPFSLAWVLREFIITLAPLQSKCYFYLRSNPHPGSAFNSIPSEDNTGN